MITEKQQENLNLKTCPNLKDVEMGNIIKELQEDSGGGYEEPDIKVVSMTIPVITADTREVVQVNLGELKNKKNALLGFYQNVAVNDDIIKMKFLASNGSLSAPEEDVYSGPQHRIFYPNIGGVPIIDQDNFIYVTDNYLFNRRLSITGGLEKYGSGTGTDIPVYASYSNIGVGVLIGWYGTTGTGVLNLDKKIEIESMWLSQNNNDTLLNIAFYNRDITSNTARSMKVAVYE